MSANRQILESFFATQQIDLRRGSIFDTPPVPLPADVRWDRVEGMMLGLAIGDALGNPSEGLLPRAREAFHGEIRDYVRTRSGDVPQGFPSDDTQLAFWTLEQMIADREFKPEQVAARFCRDQIFGIGQTVQRFLRNYKSGAKPWSQCGPRSAGNGALMRIAPMLIPHLRSGTPDLWVDTALSAMITHNDSGSIASCVAFINMFWLLLQRNTVPEPRWWLDTYVEVAKDLEVNDTYQPRGGAFQDYRGPIWRFVAEKVGEAYQKHLSAVEACSLWYSGAFLLETVPSVLFILMRHGDDPEEAIVRAVNDTVDNDTIAAIVGAAVGALHGKDNLPARWRQNLSGRTTDSDDGKICAVLESARKVWWEQ